MFKGKEPQIEIPWELLTICNKNINEPQTVKPDFFVL